ncbi:DNA polymerase III subunit gamma/tau [Chloroflexota bacterium]
MSSQVFYRKWRPQTLAEVAGQEQVTQTLRNALSSGRVSHAYLFCGPRGTGKTSTGRILAKAVNCLSNGKGEPCNTCPMCQAITEGRALDMIEVDAASNRGIDDIRELRERVNYAPNQARYKVYIIDEAHMLTKEASNALLKTLEEPPPYVIFILATTEAHKVLPTILSRCQRFDFRLISQKDIVLKLTDICSAEGIHIEPETLRLIARSASGSLRDAENLLEQLTAYYGSDIELHQIQAILGITGDWRTKELVKHIINNDVSAGVTTINSVNSDGLDLKQFNRELVEYLRGLLLMKTGSDGTVDLTAEDIAELKDLAAKASLSQILKALKLFGQLEFGFDNYSTLPLELALVDCALSSEKDGESPPSQTEYELPQPVKVAAPVRTKRSTAKPEPAKPEPAKPEPAKPEPAKPESAKPESAKPEPAKPEPVKPEPVSLPLPPAPETSTILTPPGPGSELEQLRQNWKQVVAQAPEDTKKTSAIAILRSAGVKPVAFEDNTVVLSFRYPYHKEQIEKMENQQVAEKIISNFLGHPCHVRCIYEPEDNHLVQEAQRMGAKVTNVEEK